MCVFKDYIADQNKRTDVHWTISQIVVLKIYNEGKTHMVKGHYRMKWWYNVIKWIT